ATRRAGPGRAVCLPGPRFKHRLQLRWRLVEPLANLRVIRIDRRRSVARAVPAAVAGAPPGPAPALAAPAGPARPAPPAEGREQEADQQEEEQDAEQSEPPTVVVPNRVDDA